MITLNRLVNISKDFVDLSPVMIFPKTQTDSFIYFIIIIVIIVIIIIIIIVVIIIIFIILNFVYSFDSQKNIFCSINIKTGDYKNSIRLTREAMNSRF